ncbi:MAG: 6,7-dimethyl-8-ribityllumazine synthase [Phycisphaeraceae bacterium]|nr:6,7-dimethyl-8-ribityllumazine synthase [Phycisphaerales bacterium]MCB9860842.1 6,7-dimethyl-8-ribityllumazine synthase [Phycisphaeraceae bacterium]
MMQQQQHSDGNPIRVGIIVSRYNHTITGAMLAAAIGEAESRGVKRDSIEVYDAPGAYELPMLSDRLAMSERVDGVLALGCIVRGDTWHDRHIADAIAQGLLHSQLQTGVPIAFGVLTVLDSQQAKDRAGGSKGNKGAESMAALLDTIATMRAIDRGEQRSTVQAMFDKTL